MESAILFNMHKSGLECTIPLMTSEGLTEQIRETTLKIDQLLSKEPLTDSNIKSSKFLLNAIYLMSGELQTRETGE